MRHYHKKNGTSGKFRLDLTDLNNFLYKLQQAPDEIKQGIADVATKWGQMTRDSYASKIKYAMGFNKPTMQGKSPAFDVTFEDSGPNAVIRVGNPNFIAKFLEVGTTAHTIPHMTKDHQKKTVAFVQGIHGSKALANAMKENYDELGRAIADKINNILVH